MRSIFISYRKADARGAADRLAKELKQVFGEDEVFADSRSLKPGDTWDEEIAAAVRGASAVLVVIGKQWLLERNEYGRRRLELSGDWVRLEVEAALEGGGLVIPVMVDDTAPLPEEAFEGLESIVALASRQIAPLRTADWDRDLEAIVERLDSEGLARLPEKPPPKQAATPGPDTSTHEDIESYRGIAESTHANLVLAGFQTRLRVPIDLAELYVPLRAHVDLRAAGKAEFADAADAEKRLREADAAREIPLIEAFEEAASRGRRGLVILGDPGAGKTTQLKRMLLQALRKGSQSLGVDGDLLPVFLPLRELSDLDSGLEAFIDAQLDDPHLGMPAGFGARLRARGKLLLLFDGLDEISDVEQRAAVARWLERAATGLPSCRFAVTCRFAGYSEAARLDERFLELHLRPLTREQSEAFIENWYRIVETGLAEDVAQGARLATERAGQLVQTLRGADYRSTRIVEMTRNPLLLANICLVHRDGGALPKGRAKLYEECIEVLLESWRRAGKGLSVGVSAADGRRALQPAALWMHLQEGRTTASAAELEPVLEPALRAVQWPGSAADFLRTVRDESGLLTGWSAERYGFMHLGFQEYLAACEVRRLASEGRTEALAELAGHWGESWWQEVILVLVALGNPSAFEPLMREVVRRPAFAESSQLLDFVLEEAAEVSAAPFRELLAAPRDEDGQWSGHAAALHALAQIESGDALDTLAADLADHPAATVAAWVRTRRGEAERAAQQETFVTDPGGVEMVLVRGGTFQMGAPESEKGSYADERPVHDVTVGDFYLGRYAVSNEEYARFLAANPGSPEPEYWGDRRFNGAQQPVVGVSWEEARRFAAWVGGRLPSEAEWEYAARAGTTTAYWWGDDGGKGHANFDGSGTEWSGNTSAPVNAFEPNAFGLHQMLGNVWEWVEDCWHDSYKGAPDDGSVWESGKNEARVLRGGSWSHAAGSCRAACRSGLPPVFRGSGIGFRVLCSPPSVSDRPSKT